MQVSSLITTIREDYLFEISNSEFLWDTPSLLRKLTEAERQTCNRGNLIYDDSTPSYTRIKLVSGKSSYDIDPKVTVIETIMLGDKHIEKRTKEELDRLIPTWRTDTGMLHTTIFAVISGRKIRFTPMPDAVDAGSFVNLEVFRLPDEDITSTGQEPEIPEEFHRDLIYWVLHECYKKQDADTYNQERSDYFLNRFNQIFGEPVSAKVRQHQFESPRSLVFRLTSYFKKTTSTAQDFQDFG